MQRAATDTYGFVEAIREADDSNAWSYSREEVMQAVQERIGRAEGGLC